MRRAAIFTLMVYLCHYSIYAQSDEVNADPQEASSVCDSARFLDFANKAEELRKVRRISAEDFARMASEPNTLVLDARGRTAFENLHVKGAVNLPYTDFSEASLARTIPDKSTRILIYCRNNLVSIRVGLNDNFANKSSRRPDLELEPEKGRAAGLNIPTYITLYIYGYRNVWELKPAVDPNNTQIKFVRPWGEPIDIVSPSP